MKMVMILILTQISDSMAAYECGRVISEKIVAMTSDGRECQVFTESQRYGWVWYQCPIMYRIKDGVPRSLYIANKDTPIPNVENLVRFLSDIGKDGHKLIDFFTIERGRIRNRDRPLGDNNKNPELVAAVTDRRGFKFIRHNNTNGKWQFERTFENMFFPSLSSDDARFTGVTRIKNYALFSMVEGQKSEIVIIEDMTNLRPRVDVVELNETINQLFADNVQAISYLGKNRHGIELLGVVDQVTDSQIVRVMAMSKNMTPERLYDLRPIHAFIGCPQDMCLEGGIDSIYSLSKSADDRTIFVTRGEFLCAIDRMGGRMKPVRRGTLFENEYDAEASFAVYDLDTKAHFHFHVMDYKNQVVVISYNSEDGHAKNGIDKKRTLDRNVLFGNAIPKDVKLFASLHINQYNHSNEKLILFAGNEMYEFKYVGVREKFEFKFVKSDSIKKFFDNIWPSFDTTYKDPNDGYIYVFNRDFHVKYEWKEHEIMTPMSDPVLNQGTIWECDESKLGDNYKMFDYEYQNREEYFEDIVILVILTTRHPRCQSGG